MALSLKDDPQPNKCLGVFGLSLRTTERDLKEVFSRYGPIDECTVVIDAQVCRLKHILPISVYLMIVFL